MKRLICCLLAAWLALSLCACGGSADTPAGSTAHTLTSPAPDTYFCEANGVTYTRRPALYLPMTIAQEPYATYQNEQGATLSFFALSDGSEERYLMLADPEHLYPYYLIAAEGYHTPTLAEMDPHQVLICNAEEAFFWLLPNVYDQIRTIAVVREIVAGYAAGEAATLPVWLEPTVCVELIFISATYADYAYTCTYYEYEDGSCYIHETASGKCLQVESGLFDGYRLTPEEKK